MQLRVSSVEFSEDRFLIEGSLRPGSTPENGERTVLDPLRIQGRVLPSDSVIAHGRLELQWSDTLFAPEPRPSVVTIRFPVLAHTAPPDPIDVVPRWKTPSVPQQAWIRGTALELCLTSPALPQTEPQHKAWTLELEAWNVLGSHIPILTLEVPGELPDSVRIPGHWIPDLALERIEATLEDEREFQAITADEQCHTWVEFIQRFRWEFVVAGNS